MLSVQHVQRSIAVLEQECVGEEAWKLLVRGPSGKPDLVRGLSHPRFDIFARDQVHCSAHGLQSRIFDKILYAERTFTQGIVLERVLDPSLHPQLFDTGV